MVSFPDFSSALELLGSLVVRCGGEDGEENNDHPSKARPLEWRAKRRPVFNGFNQSVATIVTLWRLASKLRGLSRIYLPLHTRAKVVRGEGFVKLCLSQHVSSAQRACDVSIVKRANILISRIFHLSYLPNTG